MSCLYLRFRLPPDAQNSSQKLPPLEPLGPHRPESQSS
ncbi:hypothetical protein PRBEI_2001812100 [Prionailurus iriomotensis]